MITRGEEVFFMLAQIYHHTIQENRDTLCLKVEFTAPLRHKLKFPIGLWQINYVGSQRTYLKNWIHLTFVYHYSFHLTWTLMLYRSFEFHSLLHGTIQTCFSEHWSNFHISNMEPRNWLQGHFNALLSLSVYRKLEIFKWWNLTIIRFKRYQLYYNNSKLTGSRTTGSVFLCLRWVQQHVGWILAEAWIKSISVVTSRGESIDLNDYFLLSFPGGNIT